MIERLRRAPEHVDELSSEMHEDIARLIEGLTEPLGRASVPQASSAEENLPKSVRDALGAIGAWSDLPDDTAETLLRWWRESKPTPPVDEQLAWLDDE